MSDKELLTLPSMARAKKNPPRSFLKYFSLVMIVVQTTVMVILLRYSKTQKVPGERPYLSSTAIAISECLKLLICLIVLSMEKDGLVKTFQDEIIYRPWETAKLIIPSGLYTVQNNLLYFALSTLDAATYQVTYQLKILTTALFSVVMLKRRLSLQQWISLVLLMVGVALVQIPADYDFKGNAHVSSKRAAGLAAVVLASLFSGFAGVFYERLLKFSAQHLWVRNTQMALFGASLGVGAVVAVDWENIREGGFFQGYNWITWAVIALQTVGGFMVSYATKYADAILKGFATSISIILSTGASWWILGDFEPTSNFFVGTTIVIVSTVSFGMPVM